MGNICGSTSHVARGEGNRLGGGETSEADARRAAAAAAEERLKQGPGGRPVKKTSGVSKKTSSSQVRKPSGTSETKPRAVSREPSALADAMASAAETREKEMYAGLSEEKANQLRLRREKEDIVGRINFYYQQVQKEPPIGLMASDVGTLKKHLTYAKTLTK